jgi:hypothetical protein
LIYLLRNPSIFAIAKMRLPGTFNLNGKNDLPSPEFIAQLRQQRSNRRAANANQDEIKSAKAIRSNPKSKSKNDNDSDKKDADNSTQNVDFTEVQDKALIEMKESNKSWKEIETNLLKPSAVCKVRWGQIKPADFDEKMKGKKEGGKNQRKQSAGEKSGSGTHSGSRAKKAKNANANGHSKKDNGDDGIPNWNNPDTNWSRTEVCIFDSIFINTTRSTKTLTEIVCHSLTSSISFSARSCGVRLLARRSVLLPRRMARRKSTQTPLLKSSWDGNRNGTSENIHLESGDCSSVFPNCHWRTDLAFSLKYFNRVATLALTSGYAFYPMAYHAHVHRKYDATKWRTPRGPLQK